MEEIKKNSGHGGSREGAGRKRKDIGRYFGFNATTQVTAILDGLTTSKSDFINEALLDYAKRKNLI